MKMKIFIFGVLFFVGGKAQNLTDMTRDDYVDMILGDLMFGCHGSSCETPPEYHHVEYPGYDGFYNNIAKPSQGGIDTPLLRLLPPVYKDGVYEPVERKANPLNVSNLLMKGSNGRTSKSGNTAFLLFFGQQVVEEILDAQGPACPPEYFNIPIPEDHEYKTMDPKVHFLPLLRTRFDMRTGFSPNNPRQQLNEITPYIDGGLVYGTSKAWADLLRVNKEGQLTPNGKLAWHSKLGPDFPAENTQRMPLANPPPPTNHSQYVERQYTANVDRFLKLGNPRGNENPFLLTFGIFWFRWHNAIAGFLKKKYPSWDGERIFNEARKWVIATQQSVTVYDWLPKYLKTNLKDYMTVDSEKRELGGYDPTTDPQISHIFQSAAMRFGHTLVPSGVYLRKKESEGCETTNLNLDPAHGDKAHYSLGVRTCNSFWRSPELFTSSPENFERFIMGMASQSTEEEDNIIVDDLRGRVFGPLEFSRRDLMAINIQRARDHGLPDYNTARKYFGLPTLDNLSPEEYAAKTKSKISHEVLLKLQSVYENNPSYVDIWPGGLLETVNGPGQLFQAVIKDQFERIRAGDRFWFENKRNGLFNENQISRIKSLKIIDIIRCITDITPNDIQRDPFTAPRDGNMPEGSCVSKLTNEKPCRVFSPTNSSFGPETTCRYLPQLNDTELEKCTRPQTYDYFSGSVTSYILTFLFTGIVITGIYIGVIFWVFLKEKKKKRFLLKTIKLKKGEFKCKERVSFLEKRVVIITFEPSSVQILVKSNIGKVLRVIELSHLESITLFTTENLDRIVIRAENHYDLYLLFSNNLYAHQLTEKLTEFCHEVEKTIFEYEKTVTEINSNIITFKDRQEQLKEVLDSVLNLNTTQKMKSKKMTSKNSNISKIQLTKYELANALGMTPDNNFFKQFFYLMDKDQNGFVTFQEFLSVMTMFTSGTEEEKAFLFFNIYDLDHSGFLTVNDFKIFIESTASQDLQGQNTSQIVESMLSLVNLRPGEKMSFDKFFEIFKSNKMFKLCVPSLMNRKSLGPQNSRFSLYGDLPEITITDEELEAKDEADDKTDRDIGGESNGKHLSYFHELFCRFSNHVRSHEKVFFWGCLYTIVMILIFAERAYYYSVEREHVGLRRIAGYGVTVTRGAASAMMFTYSSLLVTMCRNIFSTLRSSFLHKYFPFDEMIGFHKYIGWWALVWTLVHVVGHAINFYHISTQTPSDLLCIFRNFHRSTHVLPKFQYWCWETVTGLTGIFLTIHVAVIYVFASEARRHLYKAFWWTHSTHPLFFFLMILHGSGQLVQPPFFHFFFLGPCFLFCFDKMVSMSRKNIKINVLGAKHLPSNVTLLRIQRPNNFSYRSGQWMRISSVGITSMEFHPFTISSAPHERDLTLHIRGVGPWTNAIRKIYPDYENIKMDHHFKYPEIYIDGPFGEGHQTWWKYEVVVFVGGGIGVTPFASILKDIAFKSKQPISSFKCKKVIFLWVTRSQKQFEWMTDILRQVEEADTKNLIQIHIFITQFKSKYDFRTTMLFHAERHFQKLSGTSMFTGLRALTHFSRPNFAKVFQAIKEKYKTAPIVAVFTCGSLALSASVDSGCREVNKGNDPVFKHYYENF